MPFINSLLSCFSLRRPRPRPRQSSRQSSSPPSPNSNNSDSDSDRDHDGQSVVALPPTSLMRGYNTSLDRWPFYGPPPISLLNADARTSTIDVDVIIEDDDISNVSTDEVSDMEEEEQEEEEQEEEEEDDIEKFYSFKCIVCYKSTIPHHVILPCGHSHCCEACLKRIRRHYRRRRQHHLETLQKESIRPGYDIFCPTCRRDGILCQLFLGEEDFTSENQIPPPPSTLDSQVWC